MGSQLWLYYQAAQLTQFSLIYSRREKHEWEAIEQQATRPFTIDFIMWKPPKKRLPVLAPTLSHSLAFLGSAMRSWESNLLISFFPLAHL